MENKNEFTTQEMTQKEINDSLMLFKKYLKKISYEHANPTQENCYISSSDIIGVYFPNTQFKTKLHQNYNLTCISKVNNKLGVIFVKKDEINDKLSEFLPLYFFEDFDTLLYSRYFLQIREEINKDIKQTEELKNVLLNIKRVYRVNGQPFKNLLENFMGAHLYIDYGFTFSGTPIAQSLKINYDKIVIYRDDESKQQRNTPTIEEIENLIKDKIARYNIYINEQKNALKHLEKDFSKFEKICNDLKAFRKATYNYYKFENVLKYMILD